MVQRQEFETACGLIRTKQEEIEKLKILDPDKEQLRLITLLLAYSGLSFIELGKSDVIEITKTLDGPIIVGQRVKTGKPYIIPVTSDLKRIINYYFSNSN